MFGIVFVCFKQLPVVCLVLNDGNNRIRFFIFYFLLISYDFIQSVNKSDNFFLNKNNFLFCEQQQYIFTFLCIIYFMA